MPDDGYPVSADAVDVLVSFVVPQHRTVPAHEHQIFLGNHAARMESLQSDNIHDRFPLSFLCQPCPLQTHSAFDELHRLSAHANRGDVPALPIHLNVYRTRPIDFVTLLVHQIGRSVLPRCEDLVLD